MGPVLLLDAYSLLYRAQFALPSLQTSRGEPTAALYGLSALLLKLLREVGPAGLAFALDAPEPTFRHVLYREYKQNRSSRTRKGVPRPDDMELEPSHADVEPSLIDLIAAIGAPAFVAPGWEADDVLATLAREHAEHDQASLIVTGDLDLLQTVCPSVEVLIVSRGTTRAKRYDAARVRERFGIDSKQLPDYRALVGDPSDNIPGLPTIGRMTAQRLIARFGDLERLLQHVHEVQPERVRTSLIAHAEEARLFRAIERVRDDVPLPPGPRFGHISEDDRRRLRAFFERLEFRSLMARLDALDRNADA